MRKQLPKYGWRWLVPLLFLAGSLTAQNGVSDWRDVTPATVGETAILNAEQTLQLAKPVIGTPVRQVLREAKLYLMLDFGEYYVQQAETFLIALGYEVRTNNGTVEKGEIVVDNAGPEQWNVLDLTGDAQAGATEVTIEVLTLTLSDGSGNPLQANNEPGQILRWRVATALKYGVDVRGASSPYLVMEPLRYVAPASQTEQSRYVQFVWEDPAGNAYPGYEFQLLRLYNQDASLAGSVTSIRATVDWSKAMRLETQSSRPELELAVMEGSGFYLWRVRHVGNYFAEGSGNQANFGRWSASPADGEEVVLNRSSITLPGAFYHLDPDAAINWAYKRVFTEAGAGADAGRLSEGITYATALLGQRQSQARNVADEVVLISQTIPDFSGRDAWSSLPVPVDGKLAGYANNFVRQVDQSLYTASAFDQQNTLNKPRPVEDVSSSFRYYSESNPDQQIPSAEGYPFTRRIFKTDGTSRITETSGVGRTHAIGSQTDGQGRTTRVYFASASDWELIRLFGEEAPLGESVIKTITVDPNNVASVTYTSKEGKTIATALGSASSTILEGLENLDTSFLVQNRVDQNMLQGQRFVANRRLAFGAATSVDIDYEIECNERQWGCLTGDCDYIISFSVIDLNSHQVYQSSDLTCADYATAALSWTDTQSGSLVAGWGRAIELPAGEYLFVKTVRSGNTIDYVQGQAAVYEAEVRPIIDAIGVLMGGVQNGEQYDEFALELEELSDLISAHQGGDAGAMEAIKAKLDLPADYVIPADFSLDFAADTTSNEPDQLVINTGCCGAMDIPVTKPEVCLPCLALKPMLRRWETNPSVANWGDIKDTVDKYFIDYLKSELPDKGMSEQDAPTFMPGFTFSSMETMLTHMLTSRYYTGASVGGYKATEGEDGTLEASSIRIEADNDFNYDCEELYDCWRFAVGALNAFEFPDTIRIMNAFDEEQGPGPDGGSASDEHYDDPDATEGSGFFLLDWIISAKMRKFNNSDEGLITGERLLSETNLPKLFVECAGFQFAEILDEETTAVPPEYLHADPKYLAPNLPVIDPGLLSPFPPDWQARHGYYAPYLREAPGSGAAPLSPLQLTYKYIARPEWMFKYFVYNLTGEAGIVDNTETNMDDGISYLFPNQPEIEVASCYNPSCEDTETPVCFLDCNYYHDSWTAGQRLNFYRQIAGAPADPANRPGLELDTLFMAQECPLPDSLAVWGESTLAKTKDFCDTRWSDFRTGIQNALVAACYDIVECPESGSQLSPQQIDLLADRAVASCKGQVEEVREDWLADTEYPVCVEESCFWPVAIGECEEKTQVKITLFRACDQERLDQISGWGFRPFFPSKCSEGPETVTPEGEDCEEGRYSKKRVVAGNK